MDMSAIRNRIKMIEDLEAENRASNELLKSALDNEPAYTDVAKEAKEILARRKRIKEEVLGQVGNEKVVEDIKANKEEISTLLEILSAELAEYYTKEKTDEIEDSSGQKRKFKVLVRLMPK